MPACCSGGGLTTNQVVEGTERGGGASAHGDDDLFVGHGRAVAGSEDAWYAGLALGIDFNLAEAAQVERAFEPVGIGQEADLDEDAFKFDVPDLFADAVLVGDAVDLLAVAGHFGSLR